ncbi:LysR family transcriptional regulator [Chamaesiphon minutus]|uniref:Transcriptional regulator n=1 Tax=Chamaesiphon minutus (strain ATCC 27169 / PCC 6605) TaxID=1173020 RepID=K9UEZ5_CHAP6|nr:LysR family transcriptional regulator [Chamaesiphon minutus]AFY93223.1 transcriptional regulator [Chamaesiphon minutus PCC 6605]
MKSLSNMLAFVRVAEVQSFVQASNVLGLSTSAVSKAVARLEADLGVKLFHRTTRSISLTTDGVRFYEGCQQLLGELNALEAEIQGNRVAPRGRLTVSVPTAFGRICLVPVLKAFTQAFPEIALDISMDDRPVDLAEQGIDIAIRTGQLSDSANLIIRQLLTYPLMVCGSPTYFEQYEQPQHPEQLQQHTCLNFRNRSTGRFYPWSFTVEGKAERYAVSGSVVFDNADAIVRSAIAGLGLSQMPAFLAAEAISTGNLVEVLNPYRPPEVPVWICYLDRRFVAPRIRAFVDFMATQKEAFTTTCKPT